MASNPLTIVDVSKDPLGWRYAILEDGTAVPEYDCIGFVPVIGREVVRFKKGLYGDILCLKEDCILSTPKWDGKDGF